MPKTKRLSGPMKQIVHILWGQPELWIEVGCLFRYDEEVVEKGAQKWEEAVKIAKEIAEYIRRDDGSWHETDIAAIVYKPAHPEGPSQHFLSAMKPQGEGDKKEKIANYQAELDRLRKEMTKPPEPITLIDPKTGDEVQLNTDYDKGPFLAPAPPTPDAAGGGDFHEYGDDELKAPKPNDSEMLEGVVGKLQKLVNTVAAPADISAGALFESDIRSALAPLVERIAELESFKAIDPTILNLQQANDSLKLERDEVQREFDDFSQVIHNCQLRINETGINELWRKATGHNDLTYPGAAWIHQWSADTIKSLTSRVAELEGAILKAQWDDDSENWCHFCGNRPDFGGHVDGCIVSTIKEVE